MKCLKYVLTVVCLPVVYLALQRYLPNEVKEKAAQMLQLRANNKLVQQRLCQETGKVIAIIFTEGPC